MSEGTPIAGSVPFEFTVKRGDAEGFERWLWTVAPIFDVTPLEGGPDAFTIDCQGTLFGGLSQSRQSTSSTRFTRNSRVIARSGNDQVMLTVYCDRMVAVDAEKRELRLNPGDIVLLDMTQRCELIDPHGSSMTLLVQRQLLAQHVADIEALHGAVLRRDQPLHGLLLSHMEAIERLSPRFGPAEANAAAQASIGMVSACFSNVSSSKASVSERTANSKLLAICHMIERHLGDPELGADRITAQCGIGRASLYRLFESRGGVAAYIRSRRLSRAFRELSRAERTGFQIGGLARQLGFTNESSFSQMFRKAYGVKPSDLLRDVRTPPEQHLNATTDDVDLNRVNRWLLGLI